MLCGSPNAAPNAHFIRRSQMGMGIEENIFTACLDCHKAYDHSPQNESGEIYRYLRGYLKGKHPGWNENNLVYQKYRAEHA